MEGTRGAGSEMLEDAVVRASSVVVLGHGGGSDCLVANLITPWLRTLGVADVFVGGIACQWWTEPGVVLDEYTRVLGPDFYDPQQLTGARPLGDHAVLVGPDAALDGRVPYEAIYADHFGADAFVLSLRGGGRGVAAGLRSVVEHVDATVVISVDVGSDTLSTGHETRPVHTALADHLTLAALLDQRVSTFFGLAGYGCDGEMDLEEVDANFSKVLAANGLRGVVAPRMADLDDLDVLHSRRVDPVGSLVGHANRGRFGLHRVRTSTPHGHTVRLGPAAVPIWVMDPRVVADEVATDVRHLVSTSTADEAQAAYAAVGRIPETMLARVVEYSRPR
jgi:hypothetical protein